MAHVIPDGPPSPKVLRKYVRVLANIGPGSRQTQSIRDREPDLESLFDMLDDIVDSLAPGVEKAPALLRFIRSMGYKV